MDVFFSGGLAVTGFMAGLVGALLGLGGGVFVVPALALIFQVPFLTAVGTSNVAVVATSTAGASSYVRSRLANIRLGLLLLVSTTVAALVSSMGASYLPVWVLRVLFAVVLVYVAVSMLRGGRAESSSSTEALPGDSAETEGERGWDLHGSYYDRASGLIEHYRPHDVRRGMLLSLLAGAIAGLLGVGGGVVQVPVMHLLMGVPLKVATGTSNFMIGLTATGAAFVRYSHGDVNPLIAAPTALCVFAGARVGAWLVPRLPTLLLRRIFGCVALFVAALMFLQAVGLLPAPAR